MIAKTFFLPLIAVILSFVGGFFIANALNKGEMDKLRKENERLSKTVEENSKREAATTLSDEEIRAKIQRADDSPGDLAFNRDLGMALYRYGAMRQDVDLIKESARLLERVNAADPKDYEVLVSLGNAEFDIANFAKENERFVKARSIYSKAIAIKQNDAVVRTDIALTYFLEQPPKITEAINEFDRALSIDPKNERALQYLIQSYWLKGDIGSAGKALERLKQVNTSNPAIPELNSLLTRTPPQQ
ncbi:tetratricopeptide repeat protein [Leptolyngbya sp. 7M]|uniref:tetratricopeptide repeat protein n=1 Tax=Leptolyngbya sp. 7M TaxID=2812896 RepID=UPI001B8B95C5|nr:tetratricopeptide repeat protein [Leptolyngbya sp. 7M]QYO64866.1 hypothetical protein JVX88_35795 [Leptolyngbya sp. 7M]